ncbi:M50 family metallopeptidase [Amycolatopsis mongoliensis]|uniref:M50 family metallopeptidase n=1 Tax=Amycolatopsis mongoliensis TaxID=715475 RepID=A0A9Y2NL24_9PSEU|nr:M50 family metallopeptidase [Amycolatopsis sp. 4-36]WIY01800.1 M50 family metallopeptidase [Amycolatopsis sp. 4-36]
MFAVLNETVPTPGWELAGITALVAAAVATPSFAAPATGTRSLLTGANVLGTLVHEGGHALVSLLTGGGVFRIAITGPESGFTQPRNPAPPLAGILTAAAGYAMPPLAGLGIAALLHRGLVPAVLTLTTAAMVFIALFARDLLTLASVVVTGAIAYSAVRWAPAWLQNGVAYAEAWLLLTSEIGGLRALVANRLRGGFRGRQDDAALLARFTGIPAFVWIAAWFALIGWAVWHAVPLLWP